MDEPQFTLGPQTSAEAKLHPIEEHLARIEGKLDTIIRILSDDE